MEFKVKNSFALVLALEGNGAFQAFGPQPTLNGRKITGIVYAGAGASPNAVAGYNGVAASTYLKLNNTQQKNFATHSLAELLPTNQRQLSFAVEEIDWTLSGIQLGQAPGGFAGQQLTLIVYFD